MPSPTFTLVQTYEFPRATIWHFDLYRIERPEDALELGLDEALGEGIALIEWPERLGALLPRAHRGALDFGAGRRRADRASAPERSPRIRALSAVNGKFTARTGMSVRLRVYGSGTLRSSR